MVSVAASTVMLVIMRQRLRRLFSLIRGNSLRRGTTKVVIKRLGKREWSEKSSFASVQPNECIKKRAIRIASFNAALFSMAPNVSREEKPASLRARSVCVLPKSILKNSSQRLSSGNDTVLKNPPERKPNLKVSINLPDNEISLLRKRMFEEEKENSCTEKPSLRSLSSSYVMKWADEREDETFTRRQTMLDVLEELDADILALQDVQAVEEKEMKPLSDLAAGLGMNYAFAESWAPEYGNAILSKWPIKKWKTQKIFDESDFRNVLMATIDVPQFGEINFYCTLLDHLDEDWRMKQINSIIRSNAGIHILAGGLNSLDETDYSVERWSDIVNYYEEIGKPTPKAEVMKFLKSRRYTDAKEFAGECESVVIIAKGQNVQGTCKYGTRVDYILASPDSPYQFAPGSYSVVSSKGTSDHHIVKVDIVKPEVHDGPDKSRRNPKSKLIENANSFKLYELLSN